MHVDMGNVKQSYSENINLFLKLFFVILREIRGLFSKKYIKSTSNCSFLQNSFFVRQKNLFLHLPGICLLSVRRLPTVQVGFLIPLYLHIYSIAAQIHTDTCQCLALGECSISLLLTYYKKLCSQQGQNQGPLASMARVLPLS